MDARDEPGRSRDNGRSSQILTASSVIKPRQRVPAPLLYFPAHIQGGILGRTIDPNNWFTVIDRFFINPPCSIRDRELRNRI